MLPAEHVFYLNAQIDFDLLSKDHQGGTLDAVKNINQVKIDSPLRKMMTLSLSGYFRG